MESRLLRLVGCSFYIVTTIAQTWPPEPAHAQWAPRMAAMTDRPAFPIRQKYINKRQQAALVTSIPNDCPRESEYPCRAIGANACCYNTEYCYLDASLTGRCCVNGLHCANDPCPTDSYLCSPGATSSCCPRPCPATEYECVSAAGGQCCGQSSACLVNGQCTATATASVTIAVVCANGYSACGQDQAGGCCTEGSVCTESGGNPVCSFLNANGVSTQTTLSPFFSFAPSATLTAQSTSTVNDTIAHHHSGGLSTGAQAGIGIGVSLVGIALLSLIFLIWRRHRHDQNHQKMTQMTQTQNGGMNVANYQQNPSSRFSTEGTASVHPNGRHSRLINSSWLPSSATATLTNAPSLSYAPSSASSEHFSGPGRRMSQLARFGDRPNTHASSNITNSLSPISGHSHENLPVPVYPQAIIHEMPSRHFHHELE